MTRRHIEFDDDDLGQFEAPVQEALVRLLRQQKAIQERDRGVYKPPKLGAKLVPRPDLASQTRPDGSRIIPELVHQPKRQG